MYSHQLQCGAPHFRTLAKRLRNANYNYSKVLGEFLDFPVQKASKIHIRTEIDDTGRLQEISVSDNIDSGFVGITEIGAANPFNMGHEKLGHDDDNETSEFGVGMKAAALSCGNLLKVVTRVTENNKAVYYEAECDFLKMEKKEDVNDSYNPQIRSISQHDYNSIHLFDNGSTVTNSKIRNEIFPLTTIQEITEKTKDIISNMYSYYIKNGVEIKVNGEVVGLQHDFFDEENCIPFTIKKRIYILTNRSTGDLVVIASKKLEKVVWQIYDMATRKFKKLDHSFNEYVADLQSRGYEWMYCPVDDSDAACIRNDTTYVYFSELFHGNENNDAKLPFNKCDIIKDGRKYGNVSFDKKNNGSKNYIAHRVEFKSKKIGKKLGMTFNKEINLELQNDLVYALKAAINDSADKYGNSSKSDTKFDEACRKALSLKIIDWDTCKIDMLSSQLIWEKNNQQKKKQPLPKIPEKFEFELEIDEDDSSQDVETEIGVQVEDEKKDTLGDLQEEKEDDCDDISTLCQNSEMNNDENITKEEGQIAGEGQVEVEVEIQNEITDNKTVENDYSEDEFKKMKEHILVELDHLTYSSTNTQLLRDIYVQLLCKNK